MFLHLIVDSDGNASALVYVLIANDSVYKHMYIVSSMHAFVSMYMLMLLALSITFSIIVG